MSGGGYEILSIDDLERLTTTAGTQILRPLRRRLGFQPFGLNVWVGAREGDHVIEPHREKDGTEELYVVLRGTARFTLGDESSDAPIGTLVHAPPNTFREATAVEPETTVLAMGAEAGQGVHADTVGRFLRRLLVASRGRRRAGKSRDCVSARTRPGGMARPLQRRLLRIARGGHGRRARHLAPSGRAKPDRGPEVRAGRQRPRRDPWRPALHGADRLSARHRQPRCDRDARRVRLAAVRRHFGIRAFGVNGYTATTPGGLVVEEHTEDSLGHEEIYLVLRGRARFTVDGNEHELGPGELVFVRDPR